MKYRAAILAGLTAVGTLAAASHGAANVCLLVQDDKGDGTAFIAVDGGPSDPAWDIVSADVASDGKVVTAVIRVDKLSTSAASSPTGVHWRLDFEVEGGTTGLFLQGKATPFPTAPQSFNAGFIDPVTGSSKSYPAGTATGVIDVAKNEVRISFPASAAAAEAPISVGKKFSNITVSAGRYYSTAGSNPSLSEGSDSAESTKTYKVGESSCVQVGK